MHRLIVDFTGIAELEVEASIPLVHLLDLLNAGLAQVDADSGCIFLVGHGDKIVKIATISGEKETLTSARYTSSV